jgi:hypothetical protein
VVVAQVEAARAACAAAVATRLACQRERWRAQKERARARRAVTRAHEIQPRLEDVVEMVDVDVLQDVVVDRPRPRAPIRFVPEPRR